MTTPTRSGDRPRGRLLDLMPEELEEFLIREFEQPSFRARQIIRNVYQGGRRSYETMTDLPQEVRQALETRLPFDLPAIRECRRSQDGSRKYLLGLADGKTVEAVHIVDSERNTFCISSQIGCAFGCDFCLTARMGLVRQMSPGEIVGQALVLADEAGLGREGFNLVFMGMGEPLHNFDAVASALRLLLSEDCMNLSYRRVTLSTVGDIGGIRKLAKLPHRPRLAVSLNATRDDLRSRMMPVNRSHPLPELLTELAAYPLRRGERITFEYVLMAGINDSPTDADSLAALIRKIPCKVNLIPFNEDPALPQRRPPTPTVEMFRDRLLGHAIGASIRWSRGQDIRAACGQLALEEAS